MFFRKYRMTHSSGTVLFAYATETNHEVTTIIVPGATSQGLKDLSWLATGIKLATDPGLDECVVKALEFYYKDLVVSPDGYEHFLLGAVPKAPRGSDAI